MERSVLSGAAFRFTRQLSEMWGRLRVERYPSVRWHDVLTKKLTVGGTVLKTPPSAAPHHEAFNGLVMGGL